MTLHYNIFNLLFSGLIGTELEIIKLYNIFGVYYSIVNYLCQTHRSSHPYAEVYLTEVFPPVCPFGRKIHVLLDPWGFITWRPA